MPDGAWLKLFYPGDNVFNIKVKDLHTSPIVYPVPATEIDFVLKYLPQEYHDFATQGKLSVSIACEVKNLFD